MPPGTSVRGSRTVDGAIKVLTFEQPEEEARRQEARIAFDKTSNKKSQPSAT